MCNLERTQYVRYYIIALSRSQVHFLWTPLALLSLKHRLLWAPNKLRIFVKQISIFHTGAPSDWPVAHISCHATFSNYYLTIYPCLVLTKAHLQSNEIGVLLKRGHLSDEAQIICHPGNNDAKPQALFFEG